jgi:hypothetical protein
MTNETPRNPGYERRDVPARSIGWVVAGFIGVMVVIFAGVWWMFLYYRGIDSRRDVRLSVIPQASTIPPEPRLQISPTADLAGYLQEQNHLLNSYEWISRDQGKVRIPISRAMELIAQREKKP